MCWLICWVALECVLGLLWVCDVEEGGELVWEFGSGGWSRFGLGKRYVYGAREVSKGSCK